MKKTPCWKLLPLAALLTVWSGCAYLAEKKSERELEMVARRWCMTLRASQIIPIYPLNEDVQPGDVFVVETPAPRQASDYKQRGYLDLEHLLGRLNPSGYPISIRADTTSGRARTRRAIGSFPTAAAGATRRWPGFPVTRWR